MSDVILSLPHCHRHIAMYLAQIVLKILDRMSFTGFAFYIAVRCSFTTVRYTLISDKLS